MDQEQFLHHISQHQGIIHKICRLYRHSKEDREDLFQEIVFQLWKSVPGFEGASRFSTWMYRVALSTAMAGFRKKQPDIFYTHELPHTHEEPEPDDQRERLFNALAQLNDGDKALITLYLEGLTYREIADITGITQMHVGVKLNRVKTKIQQLLNIK
jgi:RNA polymerase sigma factor, sigma-70 family